MLYMSLFDLLSVDLRHEDRNNSRVYGVVTGIVQDLKDPLSLGRVKVIFPWLAEQREETVHIEDKEDRAHSYWARMATLMAGPKRGTFVIPEIDDEVLVAFEHGQLDRPVIVGMLWNKDDMPPESMDADGKNNIRSFCSRSGHRVVFDDSDDKPSILIVDKTKKNSIFIDSAKNNMEIKVEGDLTITVGGKLTITAKKDIAIESSAAISMKAQTDMSLEATSGFGAKGTSKASLESTAQTEVKGATVSVNGSAMTEVKGGLVKIN
jgi:uncharacterized protein involved in type VI secretion and phage assembly